MGRITFTANLERFVACPPRGIGGASVREALEEVFADNPSLRSYLLDEHGRLRRHINIFINDRMVADRIRLSDAVGPEDEVYVFQALSGG